MDSQQQQQQGQQQKEEEKKEAYIVASTSFWDDPADPEFVRYHGIFPSVAAANAKAKAVLSAEVGSYCVEYTDEGCLLMSRKSEFGTTKTSKGKKDTFKVQVSKITLDEPKMPVAQATFTKTVPVVKFTLLYRKFRPKQPSLVSSEVVRDQRFFLTNHAALLYFQKMKLEVVDPRVRGMQESPETFAARMLEEKDQLRFSEWVERELLDGYHLELVTKQVKVVFRADGTQAKAGFVETKNSQFVVMDWDGTEVEYNKLFPGKPLRAGPVLVDLEEEEEGDKESKKENVVGGVVGVEKGEGGVVEGGVMEKDGKAGGMGRGKKNVEDGKERVPALQLNRTQEGRVQKRPGRGASVRK